MEGAFLSKRMAILTLRVDGENWTGTCEIPWILRMISYLRNDVVTVDWKIPANVEMRSGNKVVAVRIRMEEKFRLRDALVVLDVMGT